MRKDRIAQPHMFTKCTKHSSHQCCSWLPSVPGETLQKLFKRQECSGEDLWEGGLDQQNTSCLSVKIYVIHSVSYIKFETFRIVSSHFKAQYVKPAGYYKGLFFLFNTHDLNSMPDMSLTMPK